MRSLVTAFLVCFAILGGTHVDGKAATVQDRATWLWNPWMLVQDEAGTIAFLADKKVNKVYVQVDPDVPAAVYRSFISNSQTKGIRVYALGGAPDWVALTGYTKQNQFMSWLAAYQKGSAAAQRFAGIHLDVEPYLYSGWTTKQADTVKAYQALLMKAKRSAAALKLPLEADIPFWFDEISYRNTYGTGLLAEWVIKQTNGVTIMAYRDTAPLIIDFVKKETAWAGKYGKALVIGVETGYSNEGDNISFLEEGEAYMNEALEKVQHAYAGFRGFNGIAVHHVGSWMEMKQ